MIVLTQGNIQSASGIAVPHGSITLQLNVDATIVASPYGLAVAAPIVTFQFDENGDILPNAPASEAQIYSNAELNPQNSQGVGTYYLVTIYDANGARLNSSPMFWQFPQAAGSTVDISEMFAVSTVGGNVIFYPKPGTVTSVSFAGDGTIFDSTPSAPITAAGILVPVLLNQAENTVLAGPASGGSGFPTFRALTLADLPSGIGNPPGGSNGNLQFNSSGAFGGVAGSTVSAHGTITLEPTDTYGSTTLTIVAENTPGADCLDLFNPNASGAYGIYFRQNGTNGGVTFITTDSDGDQSTVDADSFSFSNGLGASVVFGPSGTPFAVHGGTGGRDAFEVYPNGSASPTVLVPSNGALNLGYSTWTFATLPLRLRATRFIAVTRRDRRTPQHLEVWQRAAEPVVCLSMTAPRGECIKVMEPIQKLCECGCGPLAPIATRNDKKRGFVKGQPQRFIAGHQRFKDVAGQVFGRLLYFDASNAANIPLGFAAASAIRKLKLGAIA